MENCQLYLHEAPQFLRLVSVEVFHTKRINICTYSRQYETPRGTFSRLWRFQLSRDGYRTTSCFARSVRPSSGRLPPAQLEPHARAQHRAKRRWQTPIVTSIYPCSVVCTARKDHLVHQARQTTSDMHHIRFANRPLTETMRARFRQMARLVTASIFVAVCSMYLKIRITTRSRGFSQHT